MSALDATLPVSRTQLLVAVATAMVIGGAGVALVSDLPNAGGAQSPPGVGDGSAPEATIDVTASDPPNVRDSAGDVGSVSGDIDGTLAVERDVDRVEFVVRSRLPNGSWAIVDRASVASVPSGRVDLGGAGLANATYLDGVQSDGFDVETPGSTARREGFVSVTARLYVDGDRRATVTDTDGYAFLVDRPATRTAAADDSGSTSGTDASVSDESSGDVDSTDTGGYGNGNGGAGDGPGEGEDPTEKKPDDDRNRTTALFGAEGALPGGAGSSAARLSNPTDGAVTATLTVGAPIDEENGLTEPESTVDDTPNVGELSAHLHVRIFVERDGGERAYLAGGDGEYVPLADAAEATKSVDLDPDESVSVVVEWRIDDDVGNEIQSDGTTLSVHCAFESTEAFSPRVTLF